MSWFFPRPVNFNSLNFLRFAISSGNDDLANSSVTLFLVNSNNVIVKYSLKKEQNELNNEHWRSYIVNIKEPKDGAKISVNDLKEIKTIGLKDLPEYDSLYVSEILGEMNFENDFLISSDTDLNQSARMYVNGILCSREHWDTFLTQKDISSDNLDYLKISSMAGEAGENHQEPYGGKKKSVSYMVYADVWNRGITHLEDPEIREVALGGPDTATRLQTICQIKLKEIPDDVNFQDKIRIAEREIKKMNEEETSGGLTVIDPLSSSSLSSSEIGHRRTRGNHLYRIQIHDSGEEGKVDEDINDNNRATFKWSKDNASVAFAIKQLSKDEVVLEQGSRSSGNVFRIGDFIEIIDDKDELSEQPRGQMRRITQIDVKDGRTSLYWSSKVDSNPMEIGYLHDSIKIEDRSYQPELHPKVILWDGIKYVNTKEKEPSSSFSSSDDSISLNGPLDIDEFVRIRFDPGIFRSGDYWTFTTRSNGGVELLRSAKRRGPGHDYALLALIRKQTGEEIEVIEDLRRTFQPLTNLRAIDIPYDNRDEMHSGPKNVQAAIQRLSDGRMHIRSGKNNTISGSIKELLIEAGEINELKPAGGKDGTTYATRISFNDIYQHQPFLIYAIRSDNKRWDVDHEIHMFASDEEGKIFKDPVDDGTRNYAWRGFEIVAEENAQISWLAVGDSYTYFERFVKRILDEILRVIFGVDTDQLKEDSSVLDAWYKKDLQNLSRAGPDLARQAKEHWEALQNDWDRFARNIDKQVNDFQEDLEEVFDNKEEDENAVAGAVEARELPKPVAQTVNCPSCGQSYPKGKYTFCTKCRTKLPIE